MKKSISTRSFKNSTDGLSLSKRDTWSNFGRWLSTSHWFAQSLLVSFIPFKLSCLTLEGTWWLMTTKQDVFSYTRSLTTQASSSFCTQKRLVTFSGTSVSYSYCFILLFMLHTELHSCPIDHLLPYLPSRPSVIFYSSWMS